MKKIFQVTTIIIIIILLILYLINANLIINNILEYTDLFFRKLFPANFIIYILSSLLIDYGIINILSKLNLNGPIIYVTLMSLINGFPSGAKHTKDLLDKNLISTKIANYLITYTNFPNPLFLLGTISTIIGKKEAIKLFLIILISNLIIAFIFKRTDSSPIKINKFILPNFTTSLKNATYNGIKTLLVIYSSSLFFYLIAVIINKYLTLSPFNYIILNNIFDLTKGIISTTIISDTSIKTFIILLFLSFCSIPIHIQIKSIIADTSIKYKNYLIGRICQIIIGTILFFITKNN